MSASASRRSSASDPSVSSPLARAPKFSPPTSRNISPARRPLHDRSNSQTNQYSGPTIRIVEDPGTDVYSKNPFPTQPSQILAPRNAPGYAFERRDARVSDRTSVANVVAKIEASQALVPKPLQPKRAIRHSSSTSTSDADTLVASSFSPSSSRFSQGSTPPSSPYAQRLSFGKEKGLEVLEEVRPPQRSTIRAVTPSTSSSAEAPVDALTPSPPSAASLASAAPTGLPAESSSSHQRESTQINVAQSLDKGHKHTRSSGFNQKKQASSTNIEPSRPESKASAQSFAYSDNSYGSERPRSSSQPSPTLHEARTATVATGVRVHYPVVRAPSASSLWAESQELPSITSRMNNRASQVHQWSSQLSTIPSESERESRSIERASRSLSARSQSHSHDDHGVGRSYLPRRRQTVGSATSSENLSAASANSSVAMPLPLFSPITGPSHDGRESDEVHDTISPLQSPPLRKKRSGFLRRHDSDSRSTISSRPGSSQSDLSTFVANTLPTWARVYYRRGERASLGAPESSTDDDSVRINTAQSGRTDTPSEGHFPLSIYRPRNRPHQRVSHPETISLSDEEMEHDVYVIGPARRNIHQPFSPRLRPDRRSQARLSAWKAPSLDENLGSMLFSRQNRQIVLFCVGFIFPFAWMIASFLPIPPQPEMTQLPTPSQLDIERQFAREIGPIEDKSYQKANWWRNLNRIMSGLGTLLIGVIIALAVLASRMS